MVVFYVSIEAKPARFKPDDALSHSASLCKNKMRSESPSYPLPEHIHPTHSAFTVPDVWKGSGTSYRGEWGCLCCFRTTLITSSVLAMD